jgi:hypothetical protein
MYGLEYALFFGVPSNKLELIHGKSRWSFPFSSRELAEAHFHSWLETLCRWKQVDPRPPIRKSATRWKCKVNGLRMELFPRPISLEIPIAWKAFDAFLGTFNRRDFWPGQPQGIETGWDSILDDGDIRLNLWKLFGDLGSRHGGQHSGRVDIAFSDTAAAAPDAYYYRKGRKNIMIAGDYFCAAPDVIAEVLTAPSRALDRGQRMELYRRSGVPHLWLVEPALETVEVYQLHRQYELQGRFGLGESFACALFSGERIVVDELFKTQSKRWQDKQTLEDEPEPIPEWLLAPEFEVGLESFFHLGHPERRWEFWGNRAHSVLAFGSAKEARVRLDHFLTEACHWEGTSKPKIAPVAADVEQAEVGRFQLTRAGRLVFLDVAVDGRLYKDLLKIWGKREVWDWGEENIK